MSQDECPLREMKLSLELKGTVVAIELRYPSHYDAIMAHDMLLKGLKSGFVTIDLHAGNN
jgi:hypothetical protein